MCRLACINLWPRFPKGGRSFLRAAATRDMGPCLEWCSKWICDGSMWCSSGKLPAPCAGCQDGSSSDVDLYQRLDAAACRPLLGGGPVNIEGLDGTHVSNQMVWWSRLPRTGSGMFHDAIIGAKSRSWTWHSEHPESVSFRFDVGAHVCSMASKWRQPWVLDAHIPHPEPWRDPSCRWGRQKMLRPFTFGEIREPSSWCWSWIEFWWRHRSHPHAPWWAKRYYGPLKDPPSFDNFTQIHARTACEGFMTRWFCGSRCAMLQGEEPAQLTFARRQDMTARAVCAAKYVYTLVGELEDAQGLLDGLQASRALGSVRVDQSVRVFRVRERRGQGPAGPGPGPGIQMRAGHAQGMRAGHAQGMLDNVPASLPTL